MADVADDILITLSLKKAIVFRYKLPELMMTLLNDAALVLIPEYTMTSSNGNIFRVTGHLCFLWFAPE